MKIVSDYFKQIKERMRLVSDVDGSQTKRIFEVLAEETDIFEGFSMAEIDAMS